MKRIAFSLALLFTLCWSGFAQTIMFFDDFEAGTSNWVLQSSWALSPNYSYSGSNSLTDSPAGDYDNNVTSYATMANGVDLTGYFSASLTIRSIFSLENGFDSVYIQVSDDNFLSFMTIASFNGEHSLSSNTSWDEFSFSLSAFLTENNVKVRFKFMSDGGYTADGFYVDDVRISASDNDNQAPTLLYSPPEFYEGTSGPFIFNAEIFDISGIESVIVHFTVDGIMPSSGIPGNLINGDTYQFTIPAQSPGAFVDFWLTASDNAPLQNVIISDTFHYISGNYISYDNGVVDFYTIIGPGSSQPNLTACAVRISIPDSAPNIVAVLIRNYADINNPNDSMWIHIWDSDSIGGIGDDLITPFPVSPEANPLNTLAMTRIDLRPWDSLLVNQSGDIFVGFSVPSGKTNITVSSPATANRSYIWNGQTWIAASSDYCFRAITGTNQHDIAIIDQISPVSGAVLDPNETITIRVKNLGTTPQQNIPVSFNINNGPPVNEILTDTISPGDIVNYSFNTTANLSLPGNYIVTTQVSLPDDENPANNQLTTTVINYNFTSCDTLHYDGPSTSNIGLSNGGTFRVAARFPASYITPVMGGHLEQVIINIGDLPSLCKIKIWQGGNAAGPGPEIYSKNVNGLINDSSWNYLQIDSTITLSNTEYWVGYEVSHAAGKKPVGCASGPAHANGNWVSYAPGSWMHNPSYSGLGSWNIRAVICPAVLPLSAIEGTLMYANGSNTPLNNAIVYLKSGETVISQTVTDSSGHYFMDEIPAGTYSISANSAAPWGGYNSVDALGVLRHFVSINPLTGIHLIAADVSGDGFVNSMDALLIAKRFVGLITNFPKGNWAFEKKFITVNSAATITQNILGLCNGDVNGSYIP